MAIGLDIDNAARLRKQELMFAILKKRAKSGEQIFGDGVLEVLPDGFGFLRSPDTSYMASTDDIYLSPSQIRRFNLHTGDMIEGEVRVPKDGERYFALVKVDRVNGLSPEENKHKIMFENLTPLFPKEQFRLERDIKAEENITSRIIDLIAPMAARRLARVDVSVTTLDPALARVMEPRAAAPARRLRTIERLAAAGIPVGVSVSPLIPFLNEPELERILHAAREAGARSAFSIVIRLPWEVNPLFQQWLQQHFPERAARVMARIREMRGGADNVSRFGERMTGSGVWAQLLRQRLRKACDRLGLSREREPLDTGQFRPPAAAGRGGDGAQAPAQGSLF